MYNHQDLDFLCIICGKRFAFQSRLDQHKLVHQTESALECKEPDCSKKFKSIGDYNQHLKIHQDGGWYPCDFCTYKNKDKRNTMSHMRTHTKEDEGRYECDKCFKKMRYLTQFIRHKQQGLTMFVQFIHIITCGNNYDIVVISYDRLFGIFFICKMQIGSSI